MNHQSSDLSRALSLVSQRWKLVAIVAGVTMAVAFLYVTTSAKVYEATAHVGYQAPRDPQAALGNAYPDTGLSEKDIETLVSYAGDQNVIAAAAQAAGVPPGDITAKAKVSPNGPSSIVNFRARTNDPALAKKIADAWANALVQDRASIAKRHIDEQIQTTKAALAAVPARDSAGLAVTYAGKLDNLVGQRNAILGSMEVDAAELPLAPVWPSPMVAMFAALLIGVGLGCGVALVIASFDRKLGADMIDSLPAPVMVQVPLQGRVPNAMPLSPGAAGPLVIDAFAALGARVMLDRQGEKAHVILMASARSGECKSTVAANLASALARSGRRVVLIDADMRRPTQDTMFPALQGKAGLSQILQGGAQIEDALTLVSPNLAAIGSGPRQTDASVLLASVAFRTLLDRVSQIADAIVVDAPPVLPVTDSLAIAPAADLVLLCAKVGTSSLTEIEEAYAKLAGASSTRQSIVLVGTAAPTGYGYGQGEGMSYPQRSALPSGNRGAA